MTREEQPRTESARGRGASPGWSAAVATALLVAVTAALLVAVTALVYAPALGFGFVAFDDPQYVAANPAVQGGLSWESVRWAFTSTTLGNWHPLTSLSYMLDIELLGSDPTGHHAVNVVLHVANTLLLAAVLWNATGALWRSAAVAALFAVHPLHVESVAWIAERKDVLSTFFGLLAIAAWLRYARRPSPTRYLIAALPFALSLMSKSMLVTLPILLLLLDVWPLGRASSGPRRLIAEKLPLVALAAAAVVGAFVTQAADSALAPDSIVPWPARASNAVIASLAYLGKTVWPSNLAVYYPHPVAVEAGRASAAVAALLAVSAGAFVCRKSRPYLLVGWLWYLVSLLPVIGLVQLGYQSMADRYTYVPLIGVFLAVVWGVADLVRERPVLRGAVVVGSLVVLAQLAALSRQQVHYWRDTRTLFEHALEVTEANPIAHTVLGQVEAEAGDLDASVAHYREALRLEPRLDEARINLATILAHQGRLDDAAAELEAVLPGARNPVDVRMRLGNVHALAGDLDAALEQYRAVLEQQPDHVMARSNLGQLLVRKGRRAEGMTAYREALARDPAFVAARFNLAIALAADGSLDEARQELERTLQHAPEFSAARLQLALVLDQQGRRADARAEVERVLAARPNDPMAQQLARHLAEPSAVGAPSQGPPEEGGAPPAERGSPP